MEVEYSSTTFLSLPTARMSSWDETEMDDDGQRSLMACTAHTKWLAMFSEKMIFCGCGPKFVKLLCHVFVQIFWLHGRLSNHCYDKLSG